MPASDLRTCNTLTIFTYRSGSYGNIAYFVTFRFAGSGSDSVTDAPLAYEDDRLKIKKPPKPEGAAIAALLRLASQFKPCSLMLRETDE